MPETTFQPPHDLNGAVALFLRTQGRPCPEGCGEFVHRTDVAEPCEGLSVQVLRQRFAETQFRPGQSEGSVQFVLVQRLFDDVARAVEADSPGMPVARFIDLGDQEQGRLASSLRGVFGQFATLARNKAKQ